MLHWIYLLLGLSLGSAGILFWRVIALQRQVSTLNENLLSAAARAQGAEADVRHWQEKFASQSGQIQEQQQQWKLEFEKFNRQMLDASEEKLKLWSKDSLQTAVTPVESELKRLQASLREVYGQEARERMALKTEIEYMIKAQGQLSLEAQSLTRALRGDVRVQGLWGELVLERIFEASGLRKGEEYIIQGEGLALKSDEGGHRKPDVLVRLPGERHLIVDSKVSLAAYEMYVKADSDSEKSTASAEFIKSLRRHIDDLASKDYASLYGVNSPDFVMMFVPTDGAFALAHQTDPDLFSYALQKKVAIVSPSLLFPNLRTVEAIWRQERQNRNAEEIARQAGGLYDKFVSILDDLGSVQTHLRRADDSYNEVMAKIRTGKGNLIDRVEKLRLLGARTKKRLVTESDIAELESNSSEVET